jgi:hypothetical protein
MNAEKRRGNKSVVAVAVAVVGSDLDLDERVNAALDELVRAGYRQFKQLTQKHISGAWNERYMPKPEFDEFLAKHGVPRRAFTPHKFDLAVQKYLAAKPDLVVHCAKQPYDVYIGRRNPRIKDSDFLWGNPFKIDETCGRLDAVRKYKDWLLCQPGLVAKAKRELRGKVLGCWCAPLACHGDVLVQVANTDANAGGV